jgi:hypothetical protein
MPWRRWTAPSFFVDADYLTGQRGSGVEISVGLRVIF